MSPISQRFPVPTNDDAFEQLCLELLRQYWSRPKLALFGKRGERQFGIDILDLGGQLPIFAAQCKLKEPHKTLAPGAIQDEVNEAKQFSPAIGKYGILTTAKVSTQAQRKVREINEKHAKEHLFEVELLTWEVLCELLQRYPEVYEQFYGEITPGRARNIEKAVVGVNNSLDSLTAKIEGDDIDSEINDARDHAKKREFQLATLLLNRIQQKYGSQLTAHHKFRVLTNLGAAAAGEGKYSEAARLFLQALTHNPDDELARTNEVYAYYLSGELERVHQLAAERRKDYPASTRLATFWILTAPNDVSLDEIENDVNVILQTDGEVSLALSRRALMVGNFQSAAAYAKSAVAALPDWPQPHVMIVQIEIAKAIGFVSLPRQEKPDFPLALSHATTAFELAARGKDFHSQSDALIARFEIKVLQGKAHEASKDAQEAYRINGSDVNVLLIVAQSQLAEGQTEAGLETLSKAYGLDPRADVTLMYGSALVGRGTPADLDRAITILSNFDLQKIPELMRPPIATRAVQCMVAREEWDKASNYLQIIEPNVEKVVVLSLKGHVAFRRNQNGEAEQFALEARSALSGNTHAETKEFLARLFIQLGRPADALPMFQDLFDREIPTFNPRLLLDCAARMHLDAKVIEICDALHARGTVDWDLLEFELQYLEKYDSAKATQRLLDVLKQGPDHKLAAVRLSVLGI